MSPSDPPSSDQPPAPRYQPGQQITPLSESGKEQATHIKPHASESSTLASPLFIEALAPAPEAPYVPQTQPAPPAANTEPRTSLATFLPGPGRVRPINNVLLVLLILVNLYIILTPVLPGVLFHWQNTAGKRQQLEQTIAQRQNHNNSQQPGSDAAGSTAAGTDSSAVSQPTGQEQANSIIIPAMLLDQPVVEGANAYRALDKGIWRWPGGSTPDKGGNTVLAGHRFTYTTPKGVFYFLDKLHIGDTIAITWSGHTYAYKVTTTKVVKPTQTEILNPTRRPTLTLYTCTPLWSPKDRLVVTAELQTEVSS